MLEEKLDDITKEAELSNIGNVAYHDQLLHIMRFVHVGQDQLDNLRATVAQKAKENRLYIMTNVHLA